jgi:hypothetical protein
MVDYVLETKVPEQGIELSWFKPFTIPVLHRHSTEWLCLIVAVSCLQQNVE